MLVLAGAAELVVFADGQGPVRVALVFVFLMLAPGWVAVRLIDPPLDLPSRLGLAVALSLALSMAVATVLLYLRFWSMPVALTIVVGLTVIGVLLDLPSSRSALTSLAREARRSLNGLGRT
jgi:hypothetical protein